jgi:glyoxylase-like metal-dependent hydrolase (beta-lactamase superfamily II)
MSLPDQNPDDSPAEGIRYPWAEPPAYGEAVEVAANILWMRLPLPMKLDHVNVYALLDGDGWTIVDTGFATAKTRAIWATLLAGPLSGYPVRRVLATHHHPDHIGLAGWFQREHGVELLTSRTAWLFARMLQLDVHETVVPENLAYWRAAGMPERMIEQRRNERPFNFADVVDPLPLGFTRLVEGQELELGGYTWTVRFGQGHAPDHVTLWSQEEDVVIGGDQLLPGISANLGVYATEPEANPVWEWMQSARALMPFARADQLVLPGHKLPFTGLPLRLRQMVENHEGALDRLLAHIAVARRATECFAPLFRREVGEAEYGLALVETVAHLNHLHQTGRARRWKEHDGAWRWIAA